MKSRESKCQWWRLKAHEKFKICAKMLTVGPQAARTWPWHRISTCASTTPKVGWIESTRKPVLFTFRMHWISAVNRFPWKSLCLMSSVYVLFNCTNFIFRLIFFIDLEMIAHEYCTCVQVMLSSINLVMHAAFQWMKTRCKKRPTATNDLYFHKKCEIA